MDPLGCTLCKETKAVAGQVGLGLIQPLLLIPASTFMFATRHFTQRIPSPIHNRKEFWQFCKKLYKPFRFRMGININTFFYLLSFLDIFFVIWRFFQVLMLAFNRYWLFSSHIWKKTIFSICKRQSLGIKKRLMMKNRKSLNKSLESIPSRNLNSSIETKYCL